ncbi:MAG TPA: sigma 54-interacting transcriptional regulator [Methylomirabilota bacterium]|nr:sigma 54-interacting transcriptional regulator [Methylomirabilota bacterium]
MGGLGDLIGQAPVMEALREQIRQIIERTSSSRRVPPILLQGETGTGKNLVARVIHRAGPRGDGPFVNVNCAAIPVGLLEAELFGFERGAFTDARLPKAGLFQSAHGGTILLDEVALLSDALQGKLLNIIEERRVRRLGSTRSEPVDISIIAATNENLLAAVHARRFREDLYHRLAVVTLRVPSLRERREDIPILAEHFLARACQDYGLPSKRLTSGARATLCAHGWPGNVRELANLMERVALLTETSHIDSETLDLLTEAASSQGAPAPGTPVPALDAQVESLERQQLLHALEETRWNVVRAAARLGITRAMIRHRILKYDLVPPSRRARRRRSPMAPPPPPVAHPVALPPATPRWESRLVVLLMAILHPTDEARTRAELGRDFGLVVQKVESFAGRIEDAGASRIVAAFGVEPTEDAARRAALAALAIQNALARRLNSEGGSAIARIAIHADQCLVGNVGGRQQLDVDAKQRMMAICDGLGEHRAVNRVVVSPQARSLLGPRFDVDETDAVDDATTRGVRLLGYQSHRFGPRDHVAPFVGREAQLAALRSRWDDACRRRGQLVAVIGEPGIGKSRLLHELRSAIGVGSMTYLEGRGESYAAGIPYYAVIDLLKGYFHIDERDDPAAIGDKVTTQLLDHAPASDIVPLLALLEAPVADPDWPMLDPPRRRQRTLEALTRFVLRLSHVKPTLLAVEDLHWSDAETQAFLDRLIVSAPSASLMILVTYRPEFTHGWGSREGYTQIRLDALPARTAEALLHALLGTDESLGPLKRALIGRTEGNPFFLEESVRTLVETRVLSGVRGAYRLEREVPVIDASPTVQAVLAARIDRLPAGARGLLQAASVIGKQFSLRLVQASADATEDEVVHDLMKLQAAEFLYECTGFPEAEYSFKHALTHEVTYHSLPMESRRALHARIVEALEHLYRERLGEQMEVLAYHAVRGEVWEKAATYLREAGVKAFMRSANVDAMAYFTKGLEVVQVLDGATRDRHELGLLLALGPAIQATKGLGAPEAERVFGRARELSERRDNPAAAFQALWGQWMVAAGLSRIEAAQRIGRELISVAERTNDRALELEAHHAMWATSFWLGELTAVRQHAEQGMLLYDPDQHRSLAFLYGGHDPGVCSRWFAAWNFWLLGDSARARDACDAAIALAGRLAHPPTIAIALAWACGLYHFERDAAATERYARGLIDLAKDQNLPAWGAAGTIFHGWAVAGAGAGGAGIREIREGLAAAHAVGTLMPIAPLYKLVLADACLKHGLADEGLRVLDETLAGMALTGERVWHSEFHRLKGALLLARSSSDHEAAETCFRQALEVARAQDARAWELRAATSLGQLLARHDRADDARRMLGEIYNWFGEGRVDTADLRDAKRVLDGMCTART